MEKDLYREAMEGIGMKVALQEIRKVLRGKDKENVKMEKILIIVRSYVEDAAIAAREAQRREEEEDEREWQEQKIKDLFDDMMEPLEKLTIRKKVEKDDP